MDGKFFTNVLKKFYHDDPIFEKTKIVVSLYNQSFEGTLSDDFGNKLKFDGHSEDDIKGLKADYKKLTETAINYSDAVLRQYGVR